VHWRVVVAPTSQAGWVPPVPSAEVGSCSVMLLAGAGISLSGKLSKGAPASGAFSAVHLL